MQQKSINLRPRYFKLMVTGIYTRLTVTCRLSMNKEVKKEKLIVKPGFHEGVVIFSQTNAIMGTHHTQGACSCLQELSVTYLVNQ